jgi:hypothetical protein
MDILFPLDRLTPDVANSITALILDYILEKLNRLLGPLVGRSVCIRQLVEFFDQIGFVNPSVIVVSMMYSRRYS